MGNNEKTLTFEEYWKAIAAKNPGLDKPDEEVVKLKARGLRALMRQAHEEGEKHGRTLQTAISQNADMFNTIFGGRR